MRDRTLNLPNVQDLSKEQELARHLPLEGQYLIVGGPGTGKSVVALLRMKRLQEEEKDALFLVYNRLLEHSSFLFAGEFLERKTWISWFSDLYKRMFNKNIPRLTSYYDWDWQAILLEIENRGEITVNTDLFLVIDEGQDMPREFYEALIELGFENFYILADQNQQITEKNSSRQELVVALGLEEDEVIELTNNYRNTLPIARLSQCFYTDPASPRPKLPEERKSLFAPLLYTYQSTTFYQICRRILKIADSEPHKLIGIICPNNKIREKYYNTLETMNTLELEHGKPLIHTYAYSKVSTLPFNQGGIMIINLQSCKGLEFDTVFLADINNYIIFQQDEDLLKKQLYVASSRAIERLILLYCQDEQRKNLPIDTLLNEISDDILTRTNLNG